MIQAECSILRDSEVILLFSDGPHCSDGVGLPCVLLNRLLPARREHQGQQMQRLKDKNLIYEVTTIMFRLHQGEMLYLKIKDSGLWHGLITSLGLNAHWQEEIANTLTP